MLEIVSKSNNLNIYACGDSRLRGCRSENPESKDLGSAIVQICAMVIFTIVTMYFAIIVACAEGCR